MLRRCAEQGQGASCPGAPCGAGSATVRAVIPAELVPLLLVDEGTGRVERTMLDVERMTSAAVLVDLVARDALRVVLEPHGRPIVLAGDVVATGDELLDTAASRVRVDVPLVPADAIRAIDPLGLSETPGGLDGSLVQVVGTRLAALGLVGRPDVAKTVVTTLKPLGWTSTDPTRPARHRADLAATVMSGCAPTLFERILLVALWSGRAEGLLAGDGVPAELVEARVAALVGNDPVAVQLRWCFEQEQALPWDDAHYRLVLGGRGYSQMRYRGLLVGPQVTPYPVRPGAPRPEGPRLTGWPGTD